jgi:hypothetical protein
MFHDTGTGLQTQRVRNAFLCTLLCRDGQRETAKTATFSAPGRKVAQQIAPKGDTNINNDSFNSGRPYYSVLLARLTCNDFTLKSMFQPTSFNWGFSEPDNMEIDLPNQQWGPDHLSPPLNGPRKRSQGMDVDACSAGQTAYATNTLRNVLI